MTKQETPIPTVQKAALTTKETTVYLSISLPTLHRLVRAGELPFLRIGRGLRFRVEDLDAFLASKVKTSWEKSDPKRGKKTE